MSTEDFGAKCVSFLLPLNFIIVKLQMSNLNDRIPVELNWTAKKKSKQKSFGQSYPEEFDGTLDSISAALTCDFNRTGSLLAVGCNDGRLVVWDFLTRGIAKVYSAHVHPVCSVSWSRNGKKLLSASTDWNVALWDVLSGDCEHRYRFPSAIHKVQFHPRNSKKFLVCPMKHPPVLVEIDGEHHVLPVGSECEQNIVAAFDRKGEYIFTGNAKGKVLTIFRNSTSATSANTAIKSIEFSRRGRTLWKKCCFSGDGDYIVAGSSRQHSLYIWERSAGTLVKILNGTKGELLLDVVWHPIRPIICSVASGLVSIWSQTHVENWSAFAPDFKELDENVEYEEKESEFDIEDEDKEEDILEGQDMEDVDVDVVSVERPFYCSSDEEENDENLYFLPVAPEIDDPEGEMPTFEGEQQALQKPASPKQDQMPSDTLKRRASDENGHHGSSKKKPKVVDVHINGDSFDQNSEKSAHDRSGKPKRETTKPRKPGPKKSATSRTMTTKKLDADEDNSQEVPENRFDMMSKDIEMKQEGMDAMKGQVVPDETT
eukprot:gene10824-11976_t